MTQMVIEEEKQIKMRKAYFEPKTLGNKEMKDGITAVSFLSENNFSKDAYFVVGGVATQSYLPEQYRRKTSDIDLALTVPLGFTDFKKFSKSAVEYLVSKGYNIELRKGQNTYQVIYSKKEKNSKIPHAFLIEFARRGKEYILRESKRLEREILNARKKTIEGTNLAFRVSSPEDIVVPKLVRGVGSLSRHPEFWKYLPLFDGQGFKMIDKNLKMIGELRDEVVLNPGDPYACEKLRFIADSFDIRALSQTTGINQNYFETAINDWSKMRTYPQEKETLCSILLPEIEIKKYN